MDKETLNSIKNLCSVLIKGSKDLIKAVWIFGSSIKKKNPNDIDIFFLVDDTIDDCEEKSAGLLTVANILTKHTKLNLHFQRPVQLSLLWSLIIKGEPWIITAIKTSIPIYDPYNYLGLLKKLIKNKGDLKKDIKAERLISRAEDSLTDNRTLKMDFIEHMFLACLESVQIYLLLKNKTVYKPSKAIVELKKLKINTDDFFEIFNLNEKANKGSLSEFTGEDLDHYLKQTQRFISKIQKSALEDTKINQHN
ncbi:hypothetical protein FJZ20_02610 [Candidatus Pacearchaeota archaeon]|nr:hypothetical protein [Candidatus Pacearchaeota archaeon]